jgi:nitroimidazol reductase NimA-like FMN-containing flavoprotein (pyridoxamine 5'-phosphate oxidase superfamily)
VSDDEARNELARSILDANRYMTLGTADAAGRPWTSPVYFATDDRREFFWISSPTARHSHNIAMRPEVSAVVFDSRIAPGTGQGVYMSGIAQELEGSEREHALDVFARGSAADGLEEPTLADVVEPATHRMYRLAVSEHWLLDAQTDPPPGELRDRRIPVEP